VKLHAKAKAVQNCSCEQRFYEENEEFGGISDLSTFVLDFFAAFFAAFFAVLFAIFDILICLAIRRIPQSKSTTLSIRNW
jgi:hypothetical protein